MSTEAMGGETTRAASVRRGRLLEYLTIGWNSLEGLIAIASVGSPGTELEFAL